MNSGTPDFVKLVIAFSHPLFMILTLGLAFYALYLGILVRKTRSASAEERKDLIKGRFGQKHFQLGSILLVLWVVGGLGGMAATYTLYKKLFVSPHLIVGLTSVGVAALAATFAPFMQQGKGWARIAHITLATTLLGLTVAQTTTGIPIVQKMLKEMLGIA